MLARRPGKLPEAGVPGEAATARGRGELGGAEWLQACGCGVLYTSLLSEIADAKYTVPVYFQKTT